MTRHHRILAFFPRDYLYTIYEQLGFKYTRLMADCIERARISRVLRIWSRKFFHCFLRADTVTRRR